MSDVDDLRDRIARLVHDENERLRSEGGIRHAPLRYDELSDRSRKNRESIAQAVIDDLGLTVHGDDCGYHEIHSSYDTRFEEEKQ